MKKGALILVFLFLRFSIGLVAQPLTVLEGLHFNSKILGLEVPFSVCLPQDYDQSKASYPVTYLLHGLGDDASSWLEYGRIAQFAEQAVAKKEAVSMIFVMPAAYRTYYVNDYKHSFDYEDMFVQELVPYIDSLFRTKTGSSNRALMGYSMGGFGAFSLHLRHPDVFGAAVPLSMSVRTDAQYMEEDARGWDEQWGRLFGGVGLTGAARLTDEYKTYSPFYALEKLTPAQKSKLNLLMINGDEEETLCRSNEELYVLMHQLSIPHTYRVVDGGHSFQVWRAALPGALGFISDFFEGVPNRDSSETLIKTVGRNTADLQTIHLEGIDIKAFLPEGFFAGNRKYPVIYFSGPFTTDEMQLLGTTTATMIHENEVAPVILAFLPQGSFNQMETLIPALEKEWRIREGHRMRAIAAYQKEALNAIEACKSLKFSTLILLDATFTKDDLLKQNVESIFSNHESRIFQLAPNRGKSIEGNSFLHVLLRENKIQHEFRLVPSKGGLTSFSPYLPEVLTYTINRFHR